MKLRPLCFPIFAGAMLVLLTACAPVPPRTGAPSQWVPSPNFDARRPNLVVIHHTGSDAMARAVRTLTTPERKVSAHYVIGRDGTVLQLVDENSRAWHAGKSWWGGHTDINSASLGIELDNNGSEPFAEAQIQALLILLDDIRQRYSIPVANYIGHADVAPSRKDDPSTLFPWKRLAEQGFGLWCEPPYPTAASGFDLSIALTALGYDPSAPEASRRAFQRHFMRNGENATFALPEVEENALAYCLLQKKAAGQE
ncbi:N-acetylmuramoyl-L-alanine amidase [Propionivibrio sp.]|uniref:N-acetylmuramoyl-L-alanine amidase n=1 Tax=Propionivibrio sp. TaxID=2212460 RepID=UPI003BF243A3